MSQVSSSGLIDRSFPQRSLIWAGGGFASALLGYEGLGPLLPLVGALAIVPWLVALRNAGWIESIVGSVFIGLANGFAVGAWVPEALETLGARANDGLIGWSVAVLWIKGLPFGVLGLWIRATRALPHAIWLLLVGAGFLVIDAGISAWAWGVPWGLLGHSQLDSPGVAQLAVVGGVPLISAMLGALAAAYALVLGSRVRADAHRALALTAGWFALALLGMPLSQALRPAASGTRARASAGSHPPVHR